MALNGGRHLQMLWLDVSTCICHHEGMEWIIMKSKAFCEVASVKGIRLSKNRHSCSHKGVNRQ